MPVTGENGCCTLLSERETMERKPDLTEIDNGRYPFPVDVIVETCGYCNLRCIICPYPRLKRPKGEMAPATFKRIVDEMARESPGSRLWVAIMGEPLLRGDGLVENFKYAASKGIKNVYLNTNGIYLTEDMTHKILDCNIKEILISMDAITEETYNQIRVGGDFERLVQNAETFLKAKQQRGLDRPNVIVQFIVMDENEHELEDFKQYWMSRGATVKARLKFGWGSGVETPDLDKVEIERFPCPWLMRTVSIHWNGNFAQCDADYEGTRSPGNIHTHTIKHVWEGELAKRREKHRNLDFDLELCRDCRDWVVGRSRFFHPEKVSNVLK